MAYTLGGGQGYTDSVTIPDSVIAAYKGDLQSRGVTLPDHNTFVSDFQSYINRTNTPLLNPNGVDLSGTGTQSGWLRGALASNGVGIFNDLTGQNAKVYAPNQGTTFNPGRTLYDSTGKTLTTDASTTYDPNVWSTTYTAPQSPRPNPSQTSSQNADMVEIAPGQFVNAKFATPSAIAQAKAYNPNQAGLSAIVPSTQTIQQDIQNLGSTTTGYTVKSGDTLSKIASQMGVSVSDISGYRSGNPNLIYPGETLQVKKAGYTGSSANTSSNTSSTISSGTLKGTTVSTPIYSDNSSSAKADATVAGASATSKSIDDYIKLLTPPTTDASTAVSKLTSQINDALGNLNGRGAAQLTAEQAQGVQEKKQTLQNYQTELQQKSAEYEAIKAKYAELNANTEGKPITMNSIIGAQAQTNRMALAELNTKASEIALIQANVAGAQGNLTLAQDAANRSVDLKYSDAKDAIDLKLKQLDLLQGQLDKTDKIRADAITLYLQDQKDKLAVQQANEKDKNATLLNQMAKYPDAGISLNDTIQSANTKITQNSAIYQKEVAATATSANDAAVSADETRLLDARGSDGYTDPNLYASVRATSKVSPTEFDNRFAYLVNPASRSRLGLTTTNSGGGGEISAADQTKGVNYLLLNGGTQDDLTKFQTDRSFQAWVLQKAQ